MAVGFKPVYELTLISGTIFLRSTSSRATLSSSCQKICFHVAESPRGKADAEVAEVNGST
jgi:hypothetical protein